MFSANSAWFQIAILAHNMIRWTAHLGGHHTDQLIVARTIRTRLLALPARLVNRAGRLTLRLPTRWPWPTTFTTILTTPAADCQPSRSDRKSRGQARRRPDRAPPTSDPLPARTVTSPNGSNRQSTPNPARPPPAPDHQIPIGGSRLRREYNDHYQATVARYEVLVSILADSYTFPAPSGPAQALVDDLAKRIPAAASVLCTYPVLRVSGLEGG